MRKIAEHQIQEEEVKKEESHEETAKIQLVTMDQMTNFKLDDINAKLDYILKWISDSQLKK